MTIIVDFNHLVDLKQKQEFDNLVDDMILLLQDCSEHRLDVYTMELYRMKSIPMENTSDVDEALERLKFINDTISTTLYITNEDIKKIK